MIYQAYQAQADLMAPLRHVARAAQGAFSLGWPFLGQNVFSPKLGCVVRDARPRRYEP